MPGQGQGGLCRRCNRPTSKHKHKRKQVRRSQEHKLQVSTQYNTAQNQYKAHKMYKIHHRDTSKQGGLKNTSCIEAHNQYKAHDICKNTAHYTNEHKLKRRTAAHTKTQHTTSLYEASNIK